MEFDFFGQSVEYLKGVGPAKAEVLRREAQIYTFGDLLTYYPFRYIDRGSFIPINEIRDDKNYVSLRGRILKVEEKGFGKSKRLSAWLGDDTGQIELIWFSGLKWIKPKLLTGAEFKVFGKPSVFNHRLSLSHPELERAEQAPAPNVRAATSAQPAPAQPAPQPIPQAAQTQAAQPQPPAQPAPDNESSIQPVYSTTETMKRRALTSKVLSDITARLCRQAVGNIPEIIQPQVVARYCLYSREEAFIRVHHPSSLQEAENARQRLKFEELLLLQLRILQTKISRGKTQGLVFERVGPFFNDFYANRLGFPLTEAQKRVIREIRADTKTGFQMNRLVQGDVGSGKTVVALMSMLLAKDNGFQACMMAPTEILARQHFASIGGMLENSGVRVGLLTGSTAKKDRDILLNLLRDGQLDILIGTHALLEDSVNFKNLGLVVIDEQHRFGVAQRAKLWTKNSIAPHILVMTATPIPRTLGMTLYGDLDLSVIDELPPGRKPVETRHFTDRDRLRVFAFMRSEIAKGRQVYVVYPLIQESENSDLKDLMDGYESISRAFPPPQYQISIVHGKMKAEAKEFEMNRFKRGETQIMVSTTVIEVGVDVPNAGIMVIENSERFGLSQLHQLRGRVGRGGGQSYCILMTKDELGYEGRRRIETMVATNDGFKIAEEDLKLRGPGDIQGTRQSGLLSLKIADIAEDENIVRAARYTAREILSEDPGLILAKNRLLAEELRRDGDSKIWGKIS